MPTDDVEVAARRVLDGIRSWFSDQGRGPTRTELDFITSGISKEARRLALERLLAEHRVVSTTTGRLVPVEETPAAGTYTVRKLDGAELEAMLQGIGQREPVARAIYDWQNHRDPERPKRQQADIPTGHPSRRPVQAADVPPALRELVELGQRAKRAAKRAGKNQRAMAKACSVRHQLISLLYRCADTGTWLSGQRGPRAPETLKALQRIREWVKRQEEGAP